MKRFIIRPATLASPLPDARSKTASYQPITVEDHQNGTHRMDSHLVQINRQNLPAQRRAPRAGGVGARRIGALWDRRYSQSDSDEADESAVPTVQISAFDLNRASLSFEWRGAGRMPFPLPPSEDEELSEMGDEVLTYEDDVLHPLDASSILTDDEPHVVEEESGPPSGWMPTGWMDFKSPIMKNPISALIDLVEPVIRKRPRWTETNPPKLSFSTASKLSTLPAKAASAAALTFDRLRPGASELFFMNGGARTSTIPPPFLFPASRSAKKEMRKREGEEEGETTGGPYRAPPGASEASVEGADVDPSSGRLFSLLTPRSDDSTSRCSQLMSDDEMHGVNKVLNALIHREVTTDTMTELARLQGQILTETLQAVMSTLL